VQAQGELATPWLILRPSQLACRVLGLGSHSPTRAIQLHMIQLVSSVLYLTWIRTPVPESVALEVTVKHGFYGLSVGP
jgi:hypothetical protein